MAKVTFEKVNITYPGASAPTVKDLDLEIADGEFLVLVGPSGCGKSTTLRALAGLEPTSSGRITIDGKDVTNLEPGDRDIAMVFQNYALYPHLTVEQNMGFALKLAKLPKADIKSKVHAAAETLGLTDYLKRKPKDLSGGQRQRVAMGRAIVREPKAFLMDEPLSNLDAKLRVQTRAELASLQQRLGTTTVYVTHDQVEAMTMGDRVAVLKDGELQQVAPPRELYDTPANEFVAGFIGSPAMNIFDYNGGRVGVRPEKMFINKGPVGFQGVVDIVEELGAESYVYVTVGENRFVARAEGTPPQRGEDVVLTFNPREALRFDPETGRRITGLAPRRTLGHSAAGT